MYHNNDNRFYFEYYMEIKYVHRKRVAKNKNWWKNNMRNKNWWNLWRLDFLTCICAKIISFLYFILFLFLFSESRGTLYYIIPNHNSYWKCYVNRFNLIQNIIVNHSNFYFVMVHQSIAYYLTKMYNKLSLSIFRVFLHWFSWKWINNNHRFIKSCVLNLSSWNFILFY